VTVLVNGQPREVEPATTVARLLEALGVRPDGVAVAVDREVVPRSRHAEQVLAEGQRVEILRAVGGG
jgi:thiamine biosynthesis protein ThiS